MKSKIILIAVGLLFAIILFKCGSSKTDADSLPEGTLSELDWLCESNTFEEGFASFDFNRDGNQLKVWEGIPSNISSSKACVCNGNYSLSTDRKTLIISGISSQSCPWMSKLNGTYIYKYEVKTRKNGIEDKYLHFIKGDLIITRAII